MLSYVTHQKCRYDKEDFSSHRMMRNNRSRIFVSNTGDTMPYIRVNGHRTLYATFLVKECYILPGEVRAKKPSPTLNLGTNGLKVTSEPPIMARQAGFLQGQDRSAVTQPSSSHARCRLIQLSSDNHCTRYTTPLAIVVNYLWTFSDGESTASPSITV
ncbi:hypothetical protein J6590_078567 [Homalodisca vitripennis]|nr:hypothetical protein J6590_078567 [Homalodisca vitripennis]